MRPGLAIFKMLLWYQRVRTLINGGVTGRQTSGQFKKNILISEPSKDEGGAMRSGAI